MLDQEFRVRWSDGKRKFVTPAEPLVGRAGRDIARGCVARSVRPGDTVLVMMGHSRWTAGRPRAGPAVLGHRPRVHPRHDQPRRPRRVRSSAVVSSARSSRHIRATASRPTRRTRSSARPTSRARSRSSTGRSSRCAQRLEAAARGLPAAVTGSLVGSSMADNEAFAVVDSPFGPLGLLEPLVPDVALVHAAAADPAGNLVFSEPLLDGRLGRLGRPPGRRGDGRAGASTTSRASGTGCASRPPRAGGGRGAVRRPPGRLLCAGPAGPQLRRGHRALERCRRCRGPGRVRRAMSSSGCWNRRRTRSTWPGSARNSSLARGSVRPDVVEGRRRRASRRRGRRR